MVTFCNDDNNVADSTSSLLIDKQEKTKHACQTRTVSPNTIWFMKDDFFFPFLMVVVFVQCHHHWAGIWSITSSMVASLSILLTLLWLSMDKVLSPPPFISLDSGNVGTGGTKHCWSTLVKTCAGCMDKHMILLYSAMSTKNVNSNLWCQSVRIRNG